MEMALWILFCFFASVGLVQCGYWFAGMLKRPRDFRSGYHLIQLYDDPEQIEMRLRYALSLIRRDSRDYEQVILVDMGLGDECKKICENLTIGTGGVYICNPNEISDILTGAAYNLQNGINDVE